MRGLLFPGLFIFIDLKIISTYFVPDVTGVEEAGEEVNSRVCRLWLFDFAHHTSPQQKVCFTFAKKCGR